MSTTFPIRALVALIPVLAALGCSSTPAQTRPRPPIDHVWVVVLENKGYAETFAAGSPAPYLSRTLRRRGALLTRYYGTTHVSLGNYIAMVSGQAANAATRADCPDFVPLSPGRRGRFGQAIGEGCVYPRWVRTVADQLTARGRSWRAYQEDIPRRCARPAIASADTMHAAEVGRQYATRHNPFVYFRSVLDSGDCTRHDVSLRRLPADLRSKRRTPNYSFITPNLCHDGHDAPCVDGRPGGLRSADAFLRTWIPRITRSPAYRRGLVVITFDEAEGGDSSSCCGQVRGDGGGRTGTVLLSPFIAPGTVSRTPYNHYGLLRSVEDLFGLAHLGLAGRPGTLGFGDDVYTAAPG
jgi:phosphatidylinositol-3-phosphatase